VNVVYANHTPFTAGAYLKEPLIISARAINCHTLTAPLFNVREPVVGNVVTLTLFKTFAGVSRLSVITKFPVPNVYVVFCAINIVFPVPLGASLTLFTVSINVCALFNKPSLTTICIFEVPNKFATGETVIEQFGVVHPLVIFATGNNVVFVLV
jgi:hypothetical protein